ncbi:MAG: alpha/beta hydrolase [Gemmatimonadales bacterium]|nr:alpha/beta hydrolase [Gemmatimonadales bacterium]
MLRLLRAIILTVSLLFMAAILYGAWRNPEEVALDAAARAGAPGRFVALSQGTTHYEMAGPDSGRVVVLVHGFSVPYYIWDSTAAGLSGAGYRVLRYDLFGRGFSDRPDLEYDGALYDAQLGELLDSLRVTGPVDLVGLSFGGFVTAHFLTGHASRVRTLTLVDPVSKANALPGVLRLPWIGSWVWQTLRVPKMAEGQSSDFLHPEHYPTWADQYRPQMRYRGFGRALLSSAMTASRLDFDALYAGAAKTGVPVMLIWGKEDRTVPFELSLVVRRNIPGLEFLAVDSAGHLPHIEQAQLVNARLAAFLTAH